TLRSTGLLDTPPEEAFDRLTRLAARALGVPAAAISLLDESRHVFKSGFGLPGVLLAPAAFPLDASVCRLVVESAAPLLLHDVREHPAFPGRAELLELGMRAYAGVPIGSGVPLGALCAMDVRPRSWTEEEVRTLEELAAAAAAEIEWRRRDAGMRETEHRLRLHGVHLEELFEGAPEGVVLLDTDDRVVRANGEFLRMFGYTAGEVAGRPINELIVPEDLWEEGLAFSRSVTSGLPMAAETERRRSDGTRIHVSILGKPVHLDESPVAVYVVYRDITERRRAEEERRESEARYRQMFERNRALKLLIDPTTGKIVDANPAAAAFYGYPLERLRAMRVFDLNVLPPEQITHNMGLAVAEEQTQFVVQHRLASGEVRCLELHSGPVDLHGRRLLYSILHDITARRRAEEEREAAVAARNRFYAMVSHELRTPISAIMLYNDLLLSGAYGAVSPTQAEGIERSQHSAGLLLELVNEVLDLAKLEAGKMQARAEEIAVSDFLRAVAGAVAPLAEQHGCTLCVEDADAPPVLATDPRRLRQILLNLLSNALKFGRARPVRLHCRRLPEGGTAFDVVDQGPGISPADLPRIFDEFVQLGDGSQAGTGLGLPISRRLADLLGGRLEVDSTPGAGSTFRLVLPG
ncbi:MAG TPA: PAS domain S-box protein, partial [Longimicrobiaceae bacterium]